MQLTRRAAVFARCALLVALAAACTDQPLSPRPDPAGTHATSLSVGVASTLYVTITGPESVDGGIVGTWYANASGGDGTYTYKWQYRLAGNSTWSTVGTASSYSRRMPLQYEPFFLRVTVTSAGATASDEHYVYPPCGGGAC